MFDTAVAMFCGPHDEGDQPPTRRIDAGIYHALRLNAPLFIAGDAFEGAEVRRFYARARATGVITTIQAYDSRHCTLADAQAVGREILSRRLDRLERIHLVTDWWHMDRAMTMLEGELKKGTGRTIQVVPESVMNGPEPSQLVHRNERQGLADYRAGVYGARRILDPLRHRAALEL